MSKISIILLITILSLDTGVNDIDISLGECDISAVLEEKTLPANSYAVTGYGNYEEAQSVIVPTDLDDGTYSETVTRKGDNLYKVDGFNVFLKTSLCFEYAYSQEAIIEITNYQGYTFGEITFK